MRDGLRDPTVQTLALKPVRRDRDEAARWPNAGWPLARVGTSRNRCSCPFPGTVERNSATAARPWYSMPSGGILSTPSSVSSATTPATSPDSNAAVKRDTNCCSWRDPGSGACSRSGRFSSIAWSSTSGYGCSQTGSGCPAVRLAAVVGGLDSGGGGASGGLRARSRTAFSDRLVAIRYSHERTDVRPRTLPGRARPPATSPARDPRRRGRTQRSGSNAAVTRIGIARRARRMHRCLRPGPSVRARLGAMQNRSPSRSHPRTGRSAGIVHACASVIARRNPSAS